jgi:mercuric ion transport protein
MKEKSLAISSTVAALLASLCCLGPLVLGGAGLGAGLASIFAPLRPFFLAVSGALLAVGFYLVYRKPKAAEACDGKVCSPDSRVRRRAKPLLWLAAVAVAALAFFPFYGGKLLGPTKAPAAAAEARQTVKLKITGMDCEVCAGLIHRKLVETEGVVRAEVHYPAGFATVTYDSAKISLPKLVEAVDAAGYKASVAN